MHAYALSKRNTGVDTRSESSQPPAKRKDAVITRFEVTDQYPKVQPDFRLFVVSIEFSSSVRKKIYHIEHGQKCYVIRDDKEFQRAVEWIYDNYSLDRFPRR